MTGRYFSIIQHTGVNYSDYTMVTTPQDIECAWGVNEKEGLRVHFWFAKEPFSEQNLKELSFS